MDLAVRSVARESNAMSCRTCIAWKRKGADHGVCWLWLVLTASDEICPEWTPKVVTA